MTLSSDHPAEPGFTYRMLGVRVHSQLELPELGAAREASGAADIVIQRGKVPRSAGTPEVDTDVEPYVVGADGFFLEREGVGRFRVTNGNTVTVDACREAADVDVRVYLLGSVFGALCHQRGLLPLHASAVAHEGQGYAFSGPSGTGKSTLSASLCARGLEFVADDICPLALRAEGLPRILDSVRKFKLSADTLRALGYASQGHVRDHQDAPRYHVPIAETAPAFPVPLRSIYMFRHVEGTDDLRIEEISPAYAIPCLQQLTYMPRYLLAAGHAREHFRRCASLATRVALFEVYHRRGLDRLSDLVDALSDHLRRSASKTA